MLRAILARLLKEGRRLVLTRTISAALLHAAGGVRARRGGGGEKNARGEGARKPVDRRKHARSIAYEERARGWARTLASRCC